MSDLSDLYQETIVDHSKRPRNRRVLEGATNSAVGHNPLCGDRVKIQIKMDGDRVADLSFDGSGCAISTASASLMTESLKGKSKAEALAAFDRFHNLLTTDNASSAGLGKLAVFSGVKDYPMRVKCATLAWHTLHAALDGSAEQVTTE